MEKLVKRDWIKDGRAEMFRLPPEKLLRESIESGLLPSILSSTSPITCRYLRWVRSSALRIIILARDPKTIQNTFADCNVQSN